jgi:hypothetical protein
MKTFRSMCLVIAVLAPGLTRPAAAAELRPETVQGFNRYVAAYETQSASGLFLWIDGNSAEQRRARELARTGRLVMEPIRIRSGGREIDIPDGIVHHWLGTVFIPGATVDQGLALLQAYDRHGDIYKPAIARSHLIARDGDTFRFFLRFYAKKVITVVLNTEHEARFTRDSPTQAHSRIVSTRIAQVEDAGTRVEHEEPVGNDDGYLWRLNSYWRVVQRDGGIYVQCETLSLTRSIPLGLKWIIGSFVNSVPRELLSFTLVTTRTALAGGKGGR